MAWAAIAAAVLIGVPAITAAVVTWLYRHHTYVSGGPGAGSGLTWHVCPACRNQPAWVVDNCRACQGRGGEWRAPGDTSMRPARQDQLPRPGFMLSPGT